MTEKLKIIKIIHLAICGGIIMAYVMLADFSTLTNLELPTVDTTSIIYLLLPVFCIPLSVFLYKSQIKNTDTSLELEEKLPIYQTATIIRLAVLEGAAFFILFVYPEVLLLGILIILYIIYLRPSEAEFKRDFGNTNF